MTLKITQLTAAVVSDLTATTTDFEVATNVTTVPLSRKITLGVLRDFLASAVTGLAAVAVSVASLASAAGITFVSSVSSTTALATPSAFVATECAAFASTVSGAVVMGFGTTNDVTLMNRAGTVVMGIAANSTTVNFAGSVALGSGNLTVSSNISAGQFHIITSKSKLASSADGLFELFNNAASGFTRLNFGGATASFPALAVSGTSLLCRLGNDSAYTTFGTGNVALNSAAGNGSSGVVTLGNGTQSTVGAAGGASAVPLTPTGYLIFKLASTSFVIPYYAQA